MPHISLGDKGLVEEYQGAIHVSEEATLGVSTQLSLSSSVTQWENHQLSLINLQNIEG